MKLSLTDLPFGLRENGNAFVHWYNSLFWNLYILYFNFRTLVVVSFVVLCTLFIWVPHFCPAVVTSPPIVCNMQQCTNTMHYSRVHMYVYITHSFYLRVPLVIVPLQLWLREIWFVFVSAYVPILQCMCCCLMCSLHNVPNKVLPYVYRCMYCSYSNNFSGRMLYLVSVIVKKFWSVITIFCVTDNCKQLKYVILNLILNISLFARCISGVGK
jgi:hypothetical protein